MRSHFVLCSSPCFPSPTSSLPSIMAATLVSCSRAPARCSSRLPATILRRPRPFTLVIAARSASTSSSPRPPPPPYDVLFCGTDFFAATILQSLHRTPSVASSITVAVPAARDYHATRSGSGSTTKQRRSISSSSSSSSAASGAAPTHVIDYATSHSLPSLRISSDSDYPTPSPSSSSNPLLITASYGRMIPSSLLDKYASPSLTLNVHPSLLPDLRGAAPIQWAIARGYERTGVSVQQLGRGAFDRGDLLAQRGVDLPAQAGYAQLEEVLARESAELLIETLQRLPERHDARIGQDEERKTFAPKVRQEHGRVGWEEMCAEEGVNRQRGFGHQVRRRRAVDIAAAGRIAWRTDAARSHARRSPSTPISPDEAPLHHPRKSFCAMSPSPTQQSLSAQAPSVSSATTSSTHPERPSSLQSTRTTSRHGIRSS